MNILIGKSWKFEIFVTQTVNWFQPLPSRRGERRAQLSFHAATLNDGDKRFPIETITSGLVTVNLYDNYTTI